MRTLFGKAERKSRGWTEFLRSSVAKNRPWNDVVADLIAGRPKSADQKGAVWFLYLLGYNLSIAEWVGMIDAPRGCSTICDAETRGPLAGPVDQSRFVR